MKKSKQGFLSLQIMLLLVILAVCASAVYLTFSYFTASNSRTGTLTMASVQLNMLTYNSGTSEYELSSNLNVAETELTDTLLPGSTVNITGTRISNTGNKPVYALMNLNVSVKGTGVEPIYYDRWYDCSGHDVDIENFATSTYGASLISASGHADFSTTFTFPEADITNDYQGATAKFRLTAYGIQTTLPNTECYVSVPHYAGYMIATNLANIQDDNPGKNLLGLEHRQVVTSSSGEWALSNSTLRTGLENNHILIGLSSNNYFIPNNISSYTISGNSITITSTQGGYGVGLDFECLSGETYTISRGDTNEISICFYNESGTYLRDIDMASSTSYTFTIPENVTNFVILLRPANINTETTYTNLQLEKGSSATTFEPYVQYDLIPNEYRAVKYLESTGTQYINTGVTGAIEINTTFQFTTTSATSYWDIIKAVGVSSSRTYGIEVNYPTNTYLTVYEAAHPINTLAFDTNIHTYNETFSVRTEHDTNIAEWVLFKNSCKGRLYSCKIYQSGVLVRYFIPCVRKSDNKPGLFDVVKNVFYTNAGSGEFVTSEKTYAEPLMRIISEKNLLGFEDRTEVVSSDSGEWAVSNSTVRTGLGDNHILKGFTFNNYFSSNNLTSYSISGNSITIVSSQAGYGIGLDFKCLSGETYTISRGDTNPIHISFYNAGTYLSSSSVHLGTSSSNTFTIPENASNFVVVLRPADTNTETTYTNLQLERGSTATTFEPYVFAQDTYDSSTNVLTRNVGMAQFDGSEDYWVYVLNNNNLYSSVYINGYKLVQYFDGAANADNSLEILKCSHYHYKPYSPYMDSTTLGITGYTDSSAAFIITILTSTANSSSAWMSYLATEAAANNPLTVWYKLATPVVTNY